MDKREKILHFAKNNYSTLNELANDVGIDSSKFYRYLSEVELQKVKDKITKHRQKSKKKFLYIVKESDTEYYKIGMTTCKKNKRIQVLQTGNPRKLQQVILHKCENANELERALHKKYREKNVLNEWYQLTEKEIKEIQIYLSEKAINI